MMAFVFQLRAAAVVALVLGGCASPKPSPQSPTAGASSSEPQAASVDQGKDGTETLLHPNGQLRAIHRYMKGRLHGVSEYFNEQGNRVGTELFLRGQSVWKGNGGSEVPPAGLVNLVGADTGGDLQFANGAVADPSTWQIESKTQSSTAWIDRSAPEPAFLAWGGAPQISRVSIEVGKGGRAPEGLSVTRGALSASMRLGENSGFARVDGGRISSSGGEMSPVMGRQTLQVGGTRTVRTSAGTFSPEFSVIAPIQHDSTDGAVVANYANAQRTTESAASTPGATVVRAAASALKRDDGYVGLLDVGIDVAIGGLEPEVKPFGRASLGLGLGVKSAMTTLQVSSIVRLDDPSRLSVGIGIGARLWVRKFAVQLVGGQATGAHGYLVFEVSRDL